jgi:outer membrane receptor protein involved in Fe transport
MSSGKNYNISQLRRASLAIGLGLCLTSAGALAQSNASGSLFGQAPVAAGSTVLITNQSTGFSREVPIDSSGRYRMSSLPVGSYNVMLKRDGQVISTRENVSVNVGGGSEVSFTGDAASKGVQTLEGVSVIASALPAIDVSSVDSRTVLTSQQLAAIPVARNITAAALLAPGVVAGDSRYGNQALSFGGSAASENATYINGYSVTNPLNNIGSSQLPFDAIDQQQVLTGGYGAEFGRSTGGVINVITKRGTNEWKGSVATYWEPEALRSTPKSIYYPNNGSTQAGKIFTDRNVNDRWISSSTVSLGGPLIKDRLFIYGSAEATKQEGVGNGSVLVAPSTRYQEQVIKTPRWLAKIDWNINDSNIVELTGIGDKQTQELTNYAFDYTTRQRGSVANSGTYVKTGGETYIGKYTGYVTDDFTITALYGQQESLNYQVPTLGYNPAFANVSDGRTGNPTFGGARVPYTMTCPPGVTAPCRVSDPKNSIANVQDPGAVNKTHGYRVDFEYRLGNHDLRLGYDQQTLEARSGTQTSGPGYRWLYAETGNPASRPANNVAFLPIGKQEYVRQLFSKVGGSFRVDQEAVYLEDRWQLTDRWLLSLGLRNEQFKNFNADSQVYVKQRHQLAPRLGASWDVFGDSTFKVFANAGRYHLALPNNVALRGAAGSSNYSTYYTFTGIDANGIPQNLVSLADPAHAQVCKGVNHFPYFSANCEYGDAPDPKTVAAKDLKAHFQDEYVLGMEKQLTQDFNFGAKLTYRTLRSAVDDTCAAVLDGSCYLYNPGRQNTFLVDNGDGTYTEKHFSNDELTFYPLKRKYSAVDLWLEHPFDGKFYGHLAYTFSKSYGNTEGQLLSDLGQQDVSQSQAWDDRALMVGANGLLPNNRKHQIKFFGYWQMTPEWMVATNALVRSGRPKQCLSYIGPDQEDPIGYLDSYFYCVDSNTVKPRGTFGSLPWEYKIDLAVAYTPNWAKGLHLRLDVFNVIGKQVVQNQVVQYHGGNTVEQTTPGVSPAYGRTISFSDPRTFRLSAQYDFSL